MDYNMFSSCEKFDVKNTEMDCVVKTNIYVQSCSENETIVKSNNGLKIISGKYAGQIRNYLYLIEKCETNERHYQMSCNSENNIFTKLLCENMIFKEYLNI